MRIQLRDTGDNTRRYGLQRVGKGFANLYLGRRLFIAVRPGRWSFKLVELSFGKWLRSIPARSIGRE